MEKTLQSVLFGVLTRREEFTSLSLDRQGELIVQLAEALGTVNQETGLDVVIGLDPFWPMFECPDHTDTPEAMVAETKFNDDHEGHCFEVTVKCPVCGAEFYGELNRTERGW